MPISHHPLIEEFAEYKDAKNAALDDVRKWTGWPINNQLRKLRLADAGIDDSQVTDLFDWVDVGGMGLVSVDESTGDISDAQEATPIEAIIVPIVFMMLMFLIFTVTL